MNTIKIHLVLLALLGCFVLLTRGCGSDSSSSASAPSFVPPAAPIASDEKASENAIRFLENKLEQDPEDFSASSKLAGLYLQKLRETGNVQYLELATRASRASPDEAYRLAAKEYEARKDIYGADALAWTALKANKISEAQTAIKDALRLGTNDAKLLYHAAMIARASGDETAARDFLQRALKLNPQFDPLQSVIAKTLLKNQ